MNLVENPTASPRVILNQLPNSSSNALKNPQKPKILVIILDENDAQEFQEFCFQIYNQSIYLAHKNVTPILLFESYSEYQAIQKDSKTDFYILCSEKTIQKPIAQKQRQSWVVYDSGQRGSKKKILDLPNVVYYTKQIPSLRAKLESRNFISKQTLINQKYRRIYQKNQTKVKNILINPIQEYFEDDSKVQTHANFQKAQNQKHPSIIEALKSQSSHKAQSPQNNPLQQKQKSSHLYNARQVRLEVFSPSTNQSSGQTNFKPQIMNDYIEQSQPKEFKTEYFHENPKTPNNHVAQRTNQTNQEYFSTYVGPGSNRIIDLTDYQKFNQNGVFVYRKKTPSKQYYRAAQKIDRKLSHEIPNQRFPQNLPMNQASDYFMPQTPNFNPHNATYDHQNIYNDLQSDQVNPKKPYRTYDSDFYHFSSNTQKNPFQIDKNHLKINQKANLNSQNYGKTHKRTSDQMKEYLDAISSYKPENDEYKIQEKKKTSKIVEKFSKNSNEYQSPYKPPLPSLSESNVRKLIRRERPKSQSKGNSLSNRFVGPDNFQQNKEHNSQNSNIEHRFPSYTIQNYKENQPKPIQKSLARSVQNRGPHRPLLRSAQKRQHKLDSANQICKLSKEEERIGPSSISSNKNGENGLVESYIMSVDGNQKKSNRIKLATIHCQSLAERYGLSMGKQEVSILYLVDHLMDQSLLLGLREVITPNDSVYRWKNLSQLGNQIRQSVQVYGLVFVFKEQLVLEEEFNYFFEINSACYAVDVNMRNVGIEIETNRVKMKAIGELQIALKIILRRKFQITATQ